MTIMINGRKMIEVVVNTKRLCVWCLDDWAEPNDMFCLMCGFEKRQLRES